jgi:hypothetical protein
MGLFQTIEVNSTGPDRSKSNGLLKGNWKKQWYSDFVDLSSAAPIRNISLMINAQQRIQ